MARKNIFWDSPWAKTCSILSAKTKHRMTGKLQTSTLSVTMAAVNVLLHEMRGEMTAVSLGIAVPSLLDVRSTSWMYGLKRGWTYLYAVLTPEQQEGLPEDLRAYGPAMTPKAKRGGADVAKQPLWRAVLLIRTLRGVTADAPGVSALISVHKRRGGDSFLADRAVVAAEREAHAKSWWRSVRPVWADVQAGWAATYPDREPLPALVHAQPSEDVCIALGILRRATVPAKVLFGLKWDDVWEVVPEGHVSARPLEEKAVRIVMEDGSQVSAGTCDLVAVLHVLREWGKPVNGASPVVPCKPGDLAAMPLRFIARWSATGGDLVGVRNRVAQEAAEQRRKETAARVAAKGPLPSERPAPTGGDPSALDGLF